jgi:hypothetical protein
LGQAAILWRAVCVGQQQPHGLHVAGVTEFAELVGKAAAVDDLAQQCAQFFSRPAAPAWVSTTAFLPGSFGDWHVCSFESEKVLVPF